jgi:predicted transcriptional regulator
MSPDKNIISIDSDDDNENYEAFTQYLDEDTKRKKHHVAVDFNKTGEQYLKEIDRKKKVQKIDSQKLIVYILKHCNGKHGYEELNSYSYQDIKDIYNEIKQQRRPVIAKIFRFLFNL